jgi:hypothetical protein
MTDMPTPEQLQVAELRAEADEIEQRYSFDAEGVLFDLLEGVMNAWRKVDEEKALAIGSGFARRTGGVDVPWLIEQLGPQRG